MDTIKDIWFDANRIYMKTDGGETFSRPLEAFPLLKDASDRERLDFKIGKFGDDVRLRGEKRCVSKFGRSENI